MRGGQHSNTQSDASIGQQVGLPASLRACVPACLPCEGMAETVAKTVEQWQRAHVASRVSHLIPATGMCRIIIVILRGTEMCLALCQRSMRCYHLLCKKKKCFFLRVQTHICARCKVQ